VVPINKGAHLEVVWKSRFIVNYENEGKTICDYIDNTPGVRLNLMGE